MEARPGQHSGVGEKAREKLVPPSTKERCRFGMNAMVSAFWSSVTMRMMFGLSAPPERVLRENEMLRNEIRKTALSKPSARRVVCRKRVPPVMTP